MAAQDKMKKDSRKVALKPTHVTQHPTSASLNDQPSKYLYATVDRKTGTTHRSMCPINTAKARWFWQSYPV